MNPSVELQSRLQSVRSHYRVTPWIQPRDDESPLLRSWQRCRDAGMREHERISFELVSRSMLAALDDEHGSLVQAARPETERLARALRGTGCAVLLFNTRGVVIDRLCHEAGTPTLLLMATRKGVNVAERCVGTTAPAIALADGLPYLVGRDAHFFANVRPFFCVAAPIDSPQGTRLGALDVTAYDNVPSFDIYALVIDAAAAIENSLFRPSADNLLVRFHPRAELVGTALEGLALVGNDGRISGINRAAARVLCQPRQALLGQPFSEVFDRRLQSLFARPVGQRADLVEMQTRLGLQVLARFESAPRLIEVDRMTQAGVAEPGVPGTGADNSPGVGARTAAASTGQPPANLRELERLAIARTLAALDGNVSAAARQLGISRNTIYRRRGELTA
jgi:transcriptional regulator of acetoin/glycerol metabolism